MITAHTRIWDEKTKKIIGVTVTLDINVAKLAFDLGRRANASKHGKATALHGAIKAYVQPKEKTT